MLIVGLLKILAEIRNQFEFIEEFYLVCDIHNLFEGFLGQDLVKENRF